MRFDASTDVPGVTISAPSSVTVPKGGKATIKAVSYTHLDVYKRQSLERAGRFRVCGRTGQSAIRSRTTMVSSRSGPTPMAEIRQPDMASSAWT